MACTGVAADSSHEAHVSGYVDTGPETMPISLTFERIFDARGETMPIPLDCARVPVGYLVTTTTEYGVLGGLPASVPVVVLALCVCHK